MSLSIQHILLDIEGTTCPVSFVSDVLFPYALAALPSYLANHHEDQRLQELQQELLISWQSEQDPEAQLLYQHALSQSKNTGNDHVNDKDSDRERERVQAEDNTHSQDEGEGQLLGHGQQRTMLLPFLHWLNRRDIKLTAWKDLQGLIWQEGYNSGALKAALFPEVADTLRRWHQQGYVLSVYSSGSVSAQKLLYGHSENGDLTSLFSHWFDTRIGLKQETQSYRRILAELRADADAVLFISDSLAELQAASSLGIHCWLSDRTGNPGNTTQSNHNFPSLRELHELDRIMAIRPC